MENIKYNLIARTNSGTEENPIWEENKGLAVSMPYSDANYAIAQSEAYNGEIEIVDDGLPEPEQTKTPDERIAELEEALNLLLSGTTEVDADA